MLLISDCRLMIGKLGGAQGGTRIDKSSGAGLRRPLACTRRGESHQIPALIVPFAVWQAAVGLQNASEPVTLRAMSKQAIKRGYSRREFSKLSLLTVTGAATLPFFGQLRAAEAAGKPNSKVAGVQIGMNVPYSFGKADMTGEAILKNCVQIGVSGLELRTQSVEVFMGAPAELIFVPKTAPKAEAGSRSEKLRQWRCSAPMERAKAFRKMYEDAGVLIEIVKVDGIFKMSPEELDYVFTLAKTLGGRAISTEISHAEEDLKRVGEFADKHQLMVGYHGHATTSPEHWEKGSASQNTMARTWILGILSPA